MGQESTITESTKWRKSGSSGWYRSCESLAESSSRGVDTRNEEEEKVAGQYPGRERHICHDLHERQKQTGLVPRMPRASSWTVSYLLRATHRYCQCFLRWQHPVLRFRPQSDDAMWIYRSTLTSNKGREWKMEYWDLDRSVLPISSLLTDSEKQ